ncbi:Uncharacterised protein [Achromobacter sp. 2789STDY5608615]|nr:Uncharacterised protein [Achromobacter sp. 2789STDY5608615]
MVLVNVSWLAVPVLEYVLPLMETDDEPAVPVLFDAAVMTESSVAAVALALLVVRLPAASR